jgi:HSP20 family molecular chaperone IbpA
MAIRKEDQTQRNQQSGSVNQGRSGAGSTESRAGQRSDQERSRDVSREGAGSMGSGMQRPGTGQSGRDVSTRRAGQPQPTLLPALMANPALMTRALMSNPFAFAQAMNDEMDRLFSMAGRGELGQPAGQAGQHSGRTMGEWAPAIEVVQQGNELVVRADLPGLRPDDVQIEIDDHVLTISGERRARRRSAGGLLPQRTKLRVVHAQHRAAGGRRRRPGDRELRAR